MITFSLPVTLTGRVKSGEDSDGNDVYTPTTVTTSGVFDPGGSSEITQGGDIVTTQPTVYLPVPAPTAVDRVTVNGLDFEVDGDPAVWPPNPFSGWQPDYPVVVRLKRVTG